MFSIIEKFMDRLTKEQVLDFANKNNVFLSENELDFVYQFVLRNWRDLLGNPSLLDLNKYKNQFSPENFNKIEKLIKQYLTKYQHYL